MLYGNGYDQKVTVRLNDAQYNYIKALGKNADATPSEVMRSLVCYCMEVSGRNGNKETNSNG